ncbi:MAG: AraC family transcriptional regulator [Clostridia bacterium]|nr:AraC family transcriptional regulator [Clostridia bacterium]
MDRDESIMKAIDFMEDNLTDDLNLTTCAQACGYSVYHFVRLFRAVTGLTPADYIRKRRLTEIVRHMLGGGYISELAFRYGFNSKENFLRAFKKEHGILPSEYRLAGHSLRLYSRFDPDRSRWAVTPSLCWLEPFTLAVYPGDGRPAPMEWNRYHVNRLSKKLSGGRDVCDYGVSDWRSQEQRLYYHVGIRREDALGDSTGTISLELNGGLYAKFTTPPAGHDDFIEGVQQVWAHIREWLACSGWERSGGYEFERYVESSHIYSEEIYIPLKVKEYQL